MKEPKTIKERMDKMEHIILGNGVKGLYERVNDIEEHREEDKKEVLHAIREIEKRQYIFMGGIAVIIWIIEILIN